MWLYPSQAGSVLGLQTELQVLPDKKGEEQRQAAPAGCGGFCPFIAVLQAGEDAEGPMGQFLRHQPALKSCPGERGVLGPFGKQAVVWSGVRG